MSWTQPLFSLTVQSYDIALTRLTSCVSFAPRRGPRRKNANDMTEFFEGLGASITYRAEVTANFLSFSSVSAVAEMEFTTLATSKFL